MVSISTLKACYIGLLVFLVAVIVTVLYDKGLSFPHSTPKVRVELLTKDAATEVAQPLINASQGAQPLTSEMVKNTWTQSMIKETATEVATPLAKEAVTKGVQAHSWVNEVVTSRAHPLINKAVTEVAQPLIKASKGAQPLTSEMVKNTWTQSMIKETATEVATPLAKEAVTKGVQAHSWVNEVVTIRAHPLINKAVTELAKVLINKVVEGAHPPIKEVTKRAHPLLKEVATKRAQHLNNKRVAKGEAGEAVVLSLGYWEQSANALSNLMDLQCWASRVNISKVLEPSVIPESSDKSVLHFTGKRNHLTLRDLVNITHWNEVSVKRNFSPLESMKNFLKRASKDFVYVRIKYAIWPKNCESKERVARQEWYKFLTIRGFRLHKIVCIDFTTAPSHVMTEESFRDQIFQGISRNITVVFPIWRGIRKSDRTALNNTKCASCYGSGVGLSKKPTSAISYSQPHFVPLLVPSPRLKKFLDQFLSRHLSSGRYIAVMLRTQKLSKNITSIPPENNFCASGILSDWKKMVDSNNITQTLFFSDIGDHGSIKWNNVHALKFSQYVHNGLHLTLNLQQMNSVLEGITGSNNSVQIAFLHQQLVARATCVVVVGGGGFQSQTLNMYSHFHKGQECYAVRAGQCKSLYIERVYG